MDVPRGMGELSKEQAIRQDDQGFARRNGELSHTGAGKSDGADQTTSEKNPQIVQVRGVI